MGAQASQPTADGRRVLSEVTTVSRRDAVGIEIRRAIVLGRLKPGERLTETQLAADLNVSRPTLREALNQLTRDGLVTQEPYRSLRVAELTSQQIREIAVVRVELDMLAIDSVLADESGRRLAMVQKGWEQFQQLIDNPDLVVRHDAHLAFHRQLWLASGNYLLVNLWPVTEAHITIALAVDQATRPDPERSRTNHKLLIDAIAGGDRDAIRAALIAHTMVSAEEQAELLTREGTAE